MGTVGLGLSFKRTRCLFWTTKVNDYLQIAKHTNSKKNNHRHPLSVCFASRASAVSVCRGPIYYMSCVHLYGRMHSCECGIRLSRAYYMSCVHLYGRMHSQYACVQFVDSVYVRWQQILPAFSFPSSLTAKTGVIPYGVSSIDSFLHTHAHV